MHDFGKLVYLDLQKTGSTFTSSFLDQCCILQQRKYQQHEIITDDYNPDAFYFISIRHPIKLYSSLFRYGKEKGGGLFKRIEASGAVDADKLYGDFNTFTEFVLNPKNAPLLDTAFLPAISEKYGFASYRFLRLSLQRPMLKIGEHLREKTSTREFKKDFIHSLVIKNESLNEDLYDLSMRIKPEFFDPVKVEAFLSSREKTNTSKISSLEIPELDPTLQSEIARKDALLLEHYS